MLNVREDSVLASTTIHDMTAPQQHFQCLHEQDAESDGSLPDTQGLKPLQRPNAPATKATMPGEAVLAHRPGKTDEPTSAADVDGGDGKEPGAPHTAAPNGAEQAQVALLALPHMQQACRVVSQCHKCCIHEHRCRQCAC